MSTSDILRVKQFIQKLRAELREAGEDIEDYKNKLRAIKRIVE
jgi:hypothetical protein